LAAVHGPVFLIIVCTQTVVHTADAQMATKAAVLALAAVAVLAANSFATDALVLVPVAIEPCATGVDGPTTDVPTEMREEIQQTLASFKEKAAMTLARQRQMLARAAERFTETGSAETLPSAQPAAGPVEVVKGL
jgi:hypothetical protein